MMDREWQAILVRYGQPVQILTGDGDSIPARAFLQPLPEKGEEQLLPSPLGLRREDRLLYLGPPEVPLTARESQVIWQDRRYEIRSAHPVDVAGRIHHWRAVLRPVEQEAQ